MESSFVPVARFLSHAEAWPMAGRLRAEGIEAKVIRQPSSFYAYHDQPSAAMAQYMVIVPERDGARAIWILEAFDPSADDESSGHAE